MRVIIVKIQTNKVTCQQISVSPWEGAILEAVHGASKIEIVGTEFIDRDYPDPGEEFERLSQRYKGPPDTEELYVEQCFGMGGGGVAHLSTLIAQAEEKELRDLEERPHREHEELVDKLSKLPAAKRKALAELLMQDDDETEIEDPDDDQDEGGGEDPEPIAAKSQASKKKTSKKSASKKSTSKRSTASKRAATA